MFFLINTQGSSRLAFLGLSLDNLWQLRKRMFLNLSNFLPAMVNLSNLILTISVLE
nr:MAG TPA: hypothetical protein [Caudoviricetes sp.]